MNTDDMRARLRQAVSEVQPGAVNAREDAHHPFRLLASMADGSAGALPEAWRFYRNIDEARLAAREMMRDQRVLRIAIVEDRPPLQLIEWVGR